MEIKKYAKHLARLMIVLSVSFYPNNAQSGEHLEPPITEARVWAYLDALALSSEYGLIDPVYHRWAGPVRVEVFGDPRKSDIKTLENVIAEIGVLAPSLDMALVAEDGNLEVYFVPYAEIRRLEPDNGRWNLGMFRIWYDSEHIIYKGQVLISTNYTSQSARSHLIREELTQSLGLFNDSRLYRDSIFFKGWTTTQEYSAMDRQVIRMFSEGL